MHSCSHAMWSWANPTWLPGGEATPNRPKTTTAFMENRALRACTTTSSSCSTPGKPNCATWPSSEPSKSCCKSCLVIYPKSMMPDWAERKPSIVFDCENVQETFEELKARGVQFTQEPKAMPWGPFAIFVDGDGNWYGL